MFGYDDISVDFLTSSPWIVWLLLLLYVLLAVYLYVRTNPPIPSYLRVFLGFLRVLALAALFIALLEPVLTYSRQYQRLPRIAVLHDHSSSMNKIESGKSRQARVDSIVSSSDFSALNDRADIVHYFFGGHLSLNRNEVDSTRTALGDVISTLNQIELTDPSDYWLLFSEGNSNTGRDPREVARSLPTPVVAIDMAESGSGFDVALQDVDFNPVVFVGEPTEIQATLSWNGLPNDRLQVQLFDSNKNTDQSDILITQEGGLGDVTLTYVPTEPGQKLLEIRTPTLEGEENSGNNKRSISVKVLKSKVEVLLVTEHPDYEVGFLKRFLDKADKYNVDLRVLGNNTGNLSKPFPSRQTDINRYDLVILHDPDPRTLQSRSDIIESYLKDRGGAVWIFMGERYASAGPVDWLNRLLPFHQSQSEPVRYKEFHGVPSEGHLFHPSVQLADDQVSIRNVWAELPPFQSLVYCDVFSEDAVILVYQSSIRHQERIPLVGFRHHGPGKVLASAALPFWTWGFINLGFGDDDIYFSRMIEGTMSWLTVRDDFEPIRVTPIKEVFNRGELVRFDGYAFDQGFRPLTGVAGSVSLQDSEMTTPVETDLFSLGSGKYKAEFSNLRPGQYTYTAILEREGRQINKNQGKILIEPFSLEQYDQTGDPAMLTAIARLSGGDYFPAGAYHEALAAIDLTPAVTIKRSEIVIWNKYWLLIILIGALSLEWLLRKANQLI